MKRTIHYVIILCFAACSASLLTACDNYDEVPPIKETTSNRTYYINPPSVMTPDEMAEYNDIVAEYEAATK